MFTKENILNTNGLAALTRQVAPHILSAIKNASAKTGVDFAYMLQKASAESGFDSKAKSSSSSATGLYQFIDKTWLTMVKKYGAACGLGHYAKCIDDQGHVADPAVKKQILALRKDPEKSAMMAAEYASENRSYMQDQLGADAKIGSTELYLAHFLGAGGATAFMKAYQSNPLAQASNLFPKAANANRNVFYDAKTGAPRSVQAIYDMFAKKFGGADSVTATASAQGFTPTDSAAVDDSDSSATTGTMSKRQALALSLMAQLDAQQQALDASDVSGNASATATNANAYTAVPPRSFHGHETIHWFTPRQLPHDATAQNSASTLNALSQPLVTSPAELMLLARGQDGRNAAARPRADIVRSYGHLNS